MQNQLSVTATQGIQPFPTDIKTVQHIKCSEVYYECMCKFVCTDKHVHVCVYTYIAISDMGVSHCFLTWMAPVPGPQKPLTCPSSSKAITTTAAPNFFIFLAFSKKSCSPSFRLMLLTMHFPWQHFNPASITAKLEESIHSGT